MGVFSKMAATSTSGRGNPSRSSKKREVPYQDFTRIKSNVLGKRQGKQGEIQPQDLYSDPSFPPDQSSLTYVYSGDDKYEKMVFRRPKQICPDAVLIGVGGACVTDFPSHSWRQKTWFRAALVIASLSVKYMERLVPGYRSLDQTFDHDYVGAFRFNLWRFGEWIEAVVDDFLPVLCNELAFCPSLGSPPEFWAPLVEKAYAKCCKTYEAIEVGKSIDALTDLTGAVCEYFTPDVNPPENLFHTLYKSSVNRSFMVCWRNDKRLTPTGFHYDQQKTGRNEDGPEKARKYLHIITATTKFPMTDGRLIEMVRLKCVFPQEPTWNGKFCNRDVISWKSLNLDFAERYKPFTYKDEDEFWITLEDFQCNFGGLVICSGSEPFRCQGFNVERKYAAGKHLLGKNISNSLPNSGRKGSRCDRNSAERVFAESCPFASSPIGKHDTHVSGRTNHSGGQSHDIRVKETQNTIKIDNSDFTTDDSSSSGSGATSFTTKYVKKGSLRKHIHKSKRKLSHQEMVSSRKFSTGMRDKSDDSEGNGTDIGIERKFGGDDTYSTSDIYITVQASQSRENSDGRPRSAPVALPITRAQSTGSLSSLTQSTFLATRADHFRSHGSWDEMLHFKGYWQRKTGTNRLVVDSKNFGQRALLTVTKADAVNENIGPDFEGRSHVLVSLMQDYRRGSSISGILMAHIGFGVYKTKNPDKDEKRSLSKLAMVVRQDSRGDAREVSLRLDLLPGNYFIVPYCSDQDHEGEFLLRVLGEKDSIAAKTGCLVS